MAEGGDEPIQMAGKVLKRRGILAAAGAAVAGIVAKQTSQPVAAAASLQFGNLASNSAIENDALGPTLIISQSGYPVADAVFAGQASAGSAALCGIQGIIGLRPTPTFPVGVYGYGNRAADNTTGVYGEALAGSGANTKGVWGKADIGTGVYGETNGTYGVYGVNTSSNPGGIGAAGVCDSATGIGVVGASTAGVGVKGAATIGFPIVGQVTDATSINAGVLGVGTAGPGVQGQSSGGHGLVGTTAATDGVHAALIGSVQPGSNAIGLRGSVQAGAVGYAGLFDGDVIINGALRVFGSPKNAAVKHPGDGSYRLLYCMESPESWFEDFGRGTLAGDKAEIKLDPDFAALVHTDTYHVFLTEYDGHSGLYVTNTTPTGFTVMAAERDTASGAKAPTKAGSGTFSWRVVAKRKDIAGERLAKVASPPPLKSVETFTVPETPEVKPPLKRP